MQTHPVKLIADIVVTHGSRVLMVEPVGGQDGETGWFLPDDLMREVEHPEAAATRVLDEQLGLGATDLTLSHVDSFTGNDGTWHLAFHYVARFDTIPALNPAARITRTEWFARDGLPPRDQTAHGGWHLGVIKRALR